MENLTRTQLNASLQQLMVFFPEEAERLKNNAPEILDSIVRNDKQIPEFVKNIPATVVPDSCLVGVVAPVAALPGKALFDDCTQACGLVVADVAFLVFGLFGLHIGNQERVTRIYLRELDQKTLKGFARTIENLASAGKVDRVKAFATLGAEVNRAGGFKTFLKAIRDEVPYWEWIKTGVIAVAQFAIWFASDGAAFVAQVSLSLIDGTDVVLDALKVKPACKSESTGNRYQRYLLHAGTPLHETDDTFSFAVADNRDLFAIKKSHTGSHSSEIHVLSAASDYRKFILQTGTALHETDRTYEFVLAPNRDLFAIRKSNTGTHSTEIHVLSESSHYKSFSLQTGTALPEVDHIYQFLLADNRDLFAIKKSSTGTASTEIHVLSATSNYQKFLLRTGTALHETDSTYSFVLAGNRDLFAIKKSNTGTRSTEVHVLSAASNYKAFTLTTGTALHETGENFAFGITADRDLVVIKKSGTASKSTEVHILDAG